ncbi:hypothetical protein EHF33_20305 (plasmid) [Deinococcus psychrotolerans]|uniref:Uncharacterized protein n=1 Tax=Deinococcus psychrotolerans TaxID=2489213 RepID=A0A3G8YJY1_9DEIO|nr:hypothetical protein [Deinococcus psychrotolerans]AZI45253.1 hypothetical protein EHF33_20305 [Deinococcus psychrotolerans]
MSIDLRRIKNSQTAARAVLNIMAHYHVTLTNYKPVTCAQFLLLGLETFTEDLDYRPDPERRVLDVIEVLRRLPSQQKVAEMFAQSLSRADLRSVGFTAETVTMGDLGELSARAERKSYRYTKIVGSQNFKAQLDRGMLAELHSILEIVGIGPCGFSVMLYHLVKHDLYTHFYTNYQVNMEDSPELDQYTHAPLYFAVKSFLLAREDVFDEELRLLEDGAVGGVQRFLQRQGVYRISDWFALSSQFVAKTLQIYIESHGGVMNSPVGTLVLLEPREAYRQHRRWHQVYREEAVDL